MWKKAGLLFLMLSCGKDGFIKESKLSTSSEDVKVGIWTRSPSVDGSNSQITADQNLDNVVPKATVSLENVKTQNSKGLSSSKFSVLFSLDDDEFPNLNKWVGKEVPWLEKDFQAFMAYAAANKSINFMSSVVSSDTLSTAKNLDGENIFPLRIEANVCCDVFNTGYDPLGRVLSFYKHGEDNLKNFHMSDESDVVMHEMGHVLQHAVNPDLVELPYDENTDLDALQEGLSDFFSAATFSTRSILTFMENNITELLKGSMVRTGTEYKRNLNNNLAFPQGYRQDAHLDGRVVAGALADLADIFAKEKPLEEGYRNSLKLSLEAFKLMSVNSTLQKFSKLLISEFKSTLGQDICDNQASCISNMETNMRLALVKRGLLSPYDSVSSLPSLGTDYAISTILGFKEFPNYSAFSNNNGKIDPCEAIMVYPKISNLSPQNGRFYSLMDGLMMIEANNGFKELVHPNDASEILDDISADNQNVKYLPWLNPGEDSYTLISNNSSRIYKVEHGTSYTRPLSTSYFPPDTGWLVRAPASGTGTLKLLIQFRTYNAEIKAFRSLNVQASLSVNGTQSFCK